MKQRRFEIFITIVLIILSYLGNYYLKEDQISKISKNNYTWHILNIVWLLSTVIIGYWGLMHHEFKWVKIAWLICNGVFLSLLLFNKLMEHWEHPFLPDSTSTIIKTPFLFLLAAFLPRWMGKKHTPVS